MKPFILNFLRAAPLLLLSAASTFGEPILGSAQTYAVLSGSGITNTGDTVLWGDVGLFPGTLLSGFSSVTLTGSLQQTNAFAQSAQADALSAYNMLATIPFTTDLTGLDLGGMTLLPGIYKFDSSAQLTGTLTLNAQNDPNARFIFQIVSTLTTASSASVNVINGGSGNGIYWRVGSSATLGVGSMLVGNILADQSITLTTGSSIICGRAMALNAAVTMDSNTISSNCSAFDNETGRSDYDSLGFSGGSTSPAAVPEPSTYAMLGLSLLALGAVKLRRTSPVL